VPGREAPERAHEVGRVRAEKCGGVRQCQAVDDVRVKELAEPDGEPRVPPRRGRGPAEQPAEPLDDDSEPGLRLETRSPDGAAPPRMRADVPFARFLP